MGDLTDVEAEAALVSEGICTWGPDGERFERMFNVVMAMRTPPAALQAAVEAEWGWQPIETAPKDGSILVFANFDASEPEYEIGRYDPRMWTSYEDAGNGLFRKVETPISEWTHDNPARATHWVRLSGSPALNRKEAGRG